jgi:crotonobetainyl-CoA:carnitine CoA-transferase CaiB-like acyl-CoA transferase
MQPFPGDTPMSSSSIPDGIVDPSAVWPDQPPRDLPLSGIRVLDFTRILAGPYATMHLADLGADVIKVEMPRHGDETRHWGPPYTESGASSYFLSVNHGKRSLALDLSDPRSAAIARLLATRADIVIDNFLPGKMREFGLDHDVLRSMNPGLVTATISGFGADGPYAGRPGFDFLAQAMGGLMSITGPPGSDGYRVGVAVTDLMAGLFVALGIVSVLEERRRTGRGRHVEISLLDTQISMLVNIASSWLTAGVEARAFGNQHPSIAPYETLRTADRPIAVAVGTNRQFRSMARALQLEHLADDPRFATNAARVQNRSDLVRILEEKLVRHSRDYWLAHLGEAQVPVAPVNSVSEALTDPTIRARMVTEVGGVPLVRSPIRLDGMALDVSLAPPSLGADSLNILTALGVSPDTIRQFVQHGIIDGVDQVGGPPHVGGEPAGE